MRINKKGYAPEGRIPFRVLWFALAEAEKQNDHGDQDDPKQNVFAEKIASAVHSVTPFFGTELIFGSLLVYETQGIV